VEFIEALRRFSAARWSSVQVFPWFRVAARTHHRRGFTGTRFAIFNLREDSTIMRSLKAFTMLTLVALVSIVLAACTSTTGRTVGENVDDATITSEVKAKLATEKMSTLTKIGVDTDRRTVYLTGTVDDAEMRIRAEQIARSVKHVSGVVNNLTVKAQ
jgi:hyperosmotically inducible periplasmic protein